MHRHFSGISVQFGIYASTMEKFASQLVQDWAKIIISLLFEHWNKSIVSENCHEQDFEANISPCGLILETALRAVHLFVYSMSKEVAGRTFLKHANAVNPLWLTNMVPRIAEPCWCNEIATKSAKLESATPSRCSGRGKVLFGKLYPELLFGTVAQAVHVC